MSKYTNSPFVMQISRNPVKGVRSTLDIFLVDSEYCFLENDLQSGSPKKWPTYRDGDPLKGIGDSSDFKSFLKAQFAIEKNVHLGILYNPHQFSLDSIVGSLSTTTDACEADSDSNTASYLFVEDSSICESILPRELVLPYDCYITSAANSESYQVFSYQASNGKTIILLLDANEFEIVPTKEILYWTWYGDGMPAGWGGIKINEVAEGVFYEQHFGDYDDYHELFEASNKVNLAELISRRMAALESQIWFDAYYSLFTPDIREFMDGYLGESLSEWLETYEAEGEAFILNSDEEFKDLLRRELMVADPSFRLLHQAFQEPKSELAESVRKFFRDVAEGNSSMFYLYI